MYFQIEIVELGMEALLEARDIYTTRRPFFAAWDPYRTRRIEESIHAFIFENLYPEQSIHSFYLKTQHKEEEEEEACRRPTPPPIKITNVFSPE
jgi:hypothetical protein